MWYEVILDADDNDTFVVTAPDFPEVTTFGDSQPEACLNGLRAIEEAIAARISRGEDIPQPMPETRDKGRFVQMPALTFLKIALYMICKEQGVTRAELSLRLECHREQVDRLFRIDHNSKLDQMEAAFKAVGVASIFSIPTATAA